MPLPKRRGAAPSLDQFRIGIHHRKYSRPANRRAEQKSAAILLSIAFENLIVISFSSRREPERSGRFMILLALLLLLMAGPLLPQEPFAGRCAPCHGDDARGTAKAPGLAMNPRVAEQSADQLRSYLERGNPGAGMPSFADVPAAELALLVRYLRHINADTILVPVAEPGSTPTIAWGPPQPGDWLTYNGSDSGNRYSPLDLIRVSNVSSLKLKWVFPISYFGLEITPLAASGVLYVTGPNQVFALDAADRQSAVALFASGQRGNRGRRETRHQSRRCHPW